MSISRRFLLLFFIASGALIDEALTTTEITTQHTTEEIVTTIEPGYCNETKKMEQCWIATNIKDECDSDVTSCTQTIVKQCISKKEIFEYLKEYFIKAHELACQDDIKKELQKDVCYNNVSTGVIAISKMKKFSEAECNKRFKEKVTEWKIKELCEGDKAVGFLEKLSKGFTCNAGSTVVVAPILSVLILLIHFLSKLF